MADLWVNDAGVARQILDIWINDGGVARQITQIWVNDNGTARQVYTSAIVSFSADNILREGSAGVTATATFIVKANGTIHWNTTSTTDSTSLKQNWVTPTSAGGANYEVRVTATSGSFTSGSVGSFLSLGSDRTWTLSRTAAGSSVVTFTLEIRSASSGTVLDSETFSLTVDLI